MPTPLPSSTTSSVGQAQTGSPWLGATQAGDGDSTVFEEFGGSFALGASQASVGTATSGPEELGSTSTIGASQPSRGPDTARSVESIKPQTPTGAMFVPPLRAPTPGRDPKLHTRQLWEGTVTELRDKGFVAVLADKTDPANPDERAVFEFDQTEISAEDRGLISPGASFYWVIGSELTRGGTVKNVSFVQFRRLPMWTEHSLALAADRARRFRAMIQEEA